MQVTVSLLQMNAGIGQPGENLARAIDWAMEAGRRGSDIALLPELWLDGLDYLHAAELATPISEGAFAHMRQIAADARLYLAGSGFERDGSSLYNTLAVFSPAGDLIGTYRKLHLFRLMGEHLYLSQGARPSLIQLPWCKVGLSICYDLRFPELFRQYARQGANMVLIPAQWPSTRAAHWRALVQARSIEEQLYVLACNRAGHDGKVQFGGHSVIRDPWGERVIEGGTAPGLLTAAIDLDLVDSVREEIPVLRDYRQDLYY